MDLDTTTSNEPDKTSSLSSVDFDINNTSFMSEVTHFFRQIEPSNSLKKHQIMVSEYVKHTNGILVQHDLGTGKSLVAALGLADAIADNMPVIFISNKTLAANMDTAIKKLVEISGRDIPNKYVYVTMNASNMLDQVAKASSHFDTNGLDVILEKKYTKVSKINLDDKCIIVDEAHNLFNSITNGSENAIGLYKSIMKSKRSRIIFLTATPIVNHPFELVPCFNMIARQEVLPTSWDDFNRYFVDMQNKKIKNKAKFQNRLSGLLSYYGSMYNANKTSSVDFPKVNPIELVKCPMSDYQIGVYAMARDKELNEAKASAGATQSLVKPKGLFNSSYKRLSRQTSNFAFPKHAMQITKKVELFPDSVDDSDLEDLNKYSPKWNEIIKRIESGKGKALVYSSFVENTGISMFARCLEVRGWIEHDIAVTTTEYKHNHITKNKLKKGGSSRSKTFIQITGETIPEDRYKLVEKFKADDNKLGENISLILISGAGAEGIDLTGVIDVHIMEPYWNWMRILQVQGRAARYKSHIMLPTALQHVNTYIYISMYPANCKLDIVKTEETTDISLYLHSKDMHDVNSTFYRAMAEVAVDCVIHNENPSLNCKLCAPTNEMLYIPDIYKDMSVRSPCMVPEKKEVEAKELIIDSKKYAYYTDKSDKLIVLEYRDDLDGYVEIDHNKQLYKLIADRILSS